MKSRQVPFFLYWRVENVQFWINSIGHLGWLSCISNFPRFHKNGNSLELWKYISENSSPKGSFWRNKKKSEFSELSWDSPYLLAVALKPIAKHTHNPVNQSKLEPKTNVLLLIGWEGGSWFLNQSQSVVTQNQSNCELVSTLRDQSKASYEGRKEQPKVAR